MKTWIQFWLMGTFALFSTSIFAAPASESSPNQPPLQDIQRFTAALSYVKNYYVNPVQDKDLFENAIRGMVERLDPHSSYLDEKEFQELTANTKGEFSGLGLEVTMAQDAIKVITPLDDTPAAEAGVKPGDLIIMLDDQPIKGLSLREAVEKMRGKKGSKVRLTIVRESAHKPVVLDVIRDTVHVKSIKSKLYENKYGYVRISQFQSNSATDMTKAIIEMRKKAGGKLDGLVLDLRNNPGGLLDSAIDTADAFIHSSKQKPKLLVYTKGRIEGSKFSAYAKPGDILEGAPIIVLINEGSASGSEIVAGALQDYKRAILLGTRSFGKGSVQTVLPLDDTHAVKLTTALYYTPNGRSIQAEGIEPDVIIKPLNLIKENSEKEDKILAMIKESNLKGHLANGNPDRKTNEVSNKLPEPLTAIASNAHENIVYEDFQLFQALTMLKGWAAHPH